MIWKFPGSMDNKLSEMNKELYSACMSSIADINKYAYIDSNVHCCCNSITYWYMPYALFHGYYSGFDWIIRFVAIVNEVYKQAFE